VSHRGLVALVTALATVSAAGLSLSAGLALSRRSLRRQLKGLAEVLGEEDRGSIEDLLQRLQGAARKLVRPPGAPGQDPGGAVARAAPTPAAEHPTLRQVLDALPQGVVLSAPGGGPTLRNARARSLLAGPAEVLAARAVDDLLDRSADGVSAERTIELYGPPRRTLTVHTVPIRDANGSLSVLAVIEDVSELRRLEAVRSDFVANMSHELKTPAGALGLLAETLADEEDPAVSRHLADRIQAEAFRLTRIIDDLLDLSRIEASDMAPMVPVELDSLVTEALDGVRTMAQARGVALVSTESNGDLAVLGDRRQLVSALHNLLANAVKFTDSGTSVTVSTHAIPHTGDPEAVDIVVSDHGMGIPAADLERIFERFYRVDHGRGRDTGGTGLGLAIVRHVANNHGGRVWVTSREGEGSSFTLRLPLAAAALQPAEVGER
jgi:two-component system sensor histidine kinase SenX3